MRVVHLAAGAAGMYCGSCMHDNRLVAALRRAGHDVRLIPLYTPVRTDEKDVSESRVFYGGINCYLQQSSAVFRHTPWWVDRIFDTRPLLDAVGRFAGSTQPEVLGAMTLSVLRGPAGGQRKELSKLIAALRAIDPDLIHLPNLMFVGIARALKDALNVPVLCHLAGEDVFLDALVEPYRTTAFELILDHAGDVDAYVALTEYYARHATAHFALPTERVRQIPIGIETEDFTPATPGDTFTIGFLAHVCPPKGLLELVEAFIRLRAAGRECRLRAAGYLGPADRAYFDSVQARLRAAGLGDGDFTYAGELDRAGKVRFLQGLHAFSVPATYAESKGFYLLEALATGVPVVQPRRGAFPELVVATGGGLLCEPDDAGSLADGLARLMDDEPLRAQRGAAGRAAVLQHFSIRQTAAAAWALYEQVGARV